MTKPDNSLYFSSQIYFICFFYVSNNFLFVLYIELMFDLLFVLDDSSIIEVRL